MKTKLYCRRCGEELLGDGGYCHVCHENKDDTDVETRYFADDPKNKVYAVDAYITMCRCFKVEALNSKEAEELVYDMVVKATNCPDDQTLDSVDDLKLCFADNVETEASGEADESGDIKYY